MRSQVETPGQGGEEQLRLPPVGGQRRRSTSSPDPILNIPEEAKTLYRNLSFTTELFPEYLRRNVSKLSQKNIFN